MTEKIKGIENIGIEGTSETKELKELTEEMKAMTTRQILQRNGIGGDPKRKETQESQNPGVLESILQHRPFDGGEHEPNICCVCRLCQTNHNIGKRGE